MSEYAIGEWMLAVAGTLSLSDYEFAAALLLVLAAATQVRRLQQHFAPPEEVLSFTRHRFYTGACTLAPSTFPPPGPYWCMGYLFGDDNSDDRAVMVAILPKAEDVTTWWPDADVTESVEVDEITFSERFPRPPWWKPELTVVPPHRTED